MAAYTEVVKIDANALTATHWNAISNKVQGLDDGTGPTVKTFPYDYDQPTTPTGTIKDKALWVDSTQNPIPVKMYVSGVWVSLSGGSGGGAGTDIPFGMGGITGLIGLDWTPAFGRHPKVTNFVALRTRTATSQAQWNTYLSELIAGDKIILAAGVILGSSATRSIDQKNGTEAFPWMIEFLPGAMIQGVSNNNALTGLSITRCSWFILKGVNINRWMYGTYFKNISHFFLDSCKLYDTGQSQFYIHDDSTYGDMWNCRQWLSGRVNPQFGEGCYIGNHAGKWSDPTVTYTPTTPDYTHHIAIRQCHFAHSMGAESVEFKEGTTWTYLIGCTFDGRGYQNRESTGDNYSRAPINIKGDDSFVYFNTVFYPNRAGFHSYQTTASLTMGTGGWGSRHTYYGNLIFMDQSTYTGVQARLAIDLFGGLGHIVYNNNFTTLGTLTGIPTTNTP